MFNNKFPIMTVFVLVTILLSACGANGSSNSADSESSSSEEVITLAMNIPQPTTHHAYKNVYEPWAELVEEKTNGMISVDLHSSSLLGRTEDSVEDVGNGVYDVGLISVPYLYDTPFYPYTIGTLPFSFPDVQTTHNVIHKFSEEHHQEEAFKNVVSLGGFTGTEPYVIFSTKPIEKIEDVKGLKMYVSGDTVADVVKDWGATPVSIETPELYQSLERGVIDAATYPLTGAAGLNLHEVTPYIIDIGVASTPITMIINRSIYENFPDNIKEVFENEIYDFIPNSFRDSYVNEYEAALEHFIAEGVEVIKLSPEEEANFRAPSKKIWDEWVEEANEKGYDGDQLISDYIELLNEEGVNIPFEM